jgi:hypothetical protein
MSGNKYKLFRNFTVAEEFNRLIAPKELNGGRR